MQKREASGQSDGKIPKSAQETIPYREMHRDGICDVDGHYFTKQVEFFDINYQLAQNEPRKVKFPLPGRVEHLVQDRKTLIAIQSFRRRNERMFLVTILVMNLADKRQKLENNVFQTAGIAQKYNCALRRLSYQQEQGFVSTLPP